MASIGTLANQAILGDNSGAPDQAGAGQALYPNLKYSDQVNIVYPSDLPNVNGNVFASLFQFFKFNRLSILTGAELEPLGSIALPLPNDMLDKAQLSYSEAALGTALGASMLAVAQNRNDLSDYNQGNIDALNTNVISGALNAIGGVLQQKVTQFVNSLTGPNAVSAGLSLTGYAQNPFLTVLFNSPLFKRHQFTWSFIAETPQDTEILNFILNKFRYHMHPAISGGIGASNLGAGLLFTYPDIVKPVLLPQGYMYDFKNCVVENILVDYAPGNLPSFFPSNAPSAVRLNISLLEVELWSKGDYDGSNGRNYYSNL